MSNRNTILLLLPIVLIFFTGCTAPHNPLPNFMDNNLTGNWQVIEVGMNNQIKQTYNINIIHTGDIVKFFNGTTELGHGMLINKTITVTTNNATQWHGMGILLISIVNQTTMRAVPETTILKWISFEKLI